MWEREVMGRAGAPAPNDNTVIAPSAVCHTWPAMLPAHEPATLALAHEDIRTGRFRRPRSAAR